MFVFSNSVHNFKKPLIQNYTQIQNVRDFQKMTEFKKNVHNFGNVQVSKNISLLQKHDQIFKKSFSFVAANSSYIIPLPNRHRSSTTPVASHYHSLDCAHLSPAPYAMGRPTRTPSHPPIWWKERQPIWHNGRQDRSRAKLFFHLHEVYGLAQNLMVGPVLPEAGVAKMNINGTVAVVCRDA